MNKLESIKKPVAKHFESYEAFMREALRSDNDFVEGIIDYVAENRGKGIRPMLVFLMAGVHGNIGDRAYLSAMLVEMIHNASLLHDDVIDEADTRHGHPSVNARWNSEVSVLMGDYILARSFASGMESGEFDVVRYVTSGVSELAEGELIQMDVNTRRAMTRQSYLDIIFKKTATLLGVSAGSGAMAAGATEKDVELARSVGIDLGMAFQIKDDMLDYAPQEQTGKPFGADLREKKITLPLLTILERCDAQTREDIMARIERIDVAPEEILYIYEFVLNGGGLRAAAEVMHGYLDSARKVIATYPQSEYRQSLLELCDYIGVRNH